ncbi:MAG: hypothetical protein ACQER9_04630 [Nanobdellota archaeon]
MINKFLLERLSSYVQNLQSLLEEKLEENAFTETSLEHANQSAINYLEGMSELKCFWNIPFRQFLKHGKPRCLEKSIYTYAAFLNACEVTGSPELMEDVELVFGNVIDDNGEKRGHAYLEQKGLVFETVSKNRGKFTEYRKVSSLRITETDEIFTLPYKSEDNLKPCYSVMIRPIIRQIPIQYLL